MSENENKKEKIISQAVVNRLPRYYRYLTELINSGYYKISSGELSKKMSVTASQIRQDLNCFGGFGQQGYGYNVVHLHKEIGNILGVDKQFRAIIVGTGNLGKTLANSGLFIKRGVYLKALFDIDTGVIGQKVADFTVMDIKNAPEYCKSEKIDIAVLTLPKESTELVAKILAEAGVRGFWNFSNMELNIIKDNVKVENFHMGDSLMTLCYALAIKNDDGDKSEQGE